MRVFWFFLQGLVLAFFLYFLCFSESSLPFNFNLLLSLNIYSNEKKCTDNFLYLFASKSLLCILDWFFSISYNDLIEYFEFKSHFPITGKSNCNWFFVPSPIGFQNIFGRVILCKLRQVFLWILVESRQLKSCDANADIIS